MKLAQFLTLPDDELRSLTSLDLSDNYIGAESTDNDFEPFCQALAKCAALQSVNLNANALGQAGKTRLNTLGESLAQCRSLESLDIGFNLFDDADLVTLVEFLPQLRALKYLILDNNSFRHFNMDLLPTLGRLLNKCHLHTLSWKTGSFQNLSNQEFSDFWNNFAPEIEALCVNDSDSEENPLERVAPLRVLNLQGNSLRKFPTELVAFIQNLPLLKELYLKGTFPDELDTKNLDTLRNGFANCKSLTVFGIKGLNPPASAPTPVSKPNLVNG